ncbi:hypothetical protein GCM10023091_17020 [Ravibacter arvi]|uniref:Uncharacterized protein n=1 Tax=Ravibacter arvi TaxID=2051041 RepID=A0ABP8LUX9_9BACT
MKKRLTRVFGERLSGETPVTLPKNTPVNVVKRTGDTLFGRVTQQSSTRLLLEDNRFHPHSIPIPDIDVVVYDMPAPF